MLVGGCWLHGSGGVRLVTSLFPLSKWKAVLASSGLLSWPSSSARDCSVSMSFPSCIALPRLLKQVMRCGTRLSDRDVKMSAAQSQLKRHSGNPAVATDKTKELLDSKEEKYAELVEDSRCRLVVLGVETGGRWSSETVDSWTP